MKPKILVFLFTLILAFMSPDFVLAAQPEVATAAVAPAQQEAAPRSISNQPGQVLCLPGVYFDIVSDCRPDGPSTYLTEMARHNLTFPPMPMPVAAPDFNLTYSRVSYGQVKTEKAPVYGSIEDALNLRKKNAIEQIDAYFSYISYTDETFVDGKRLYMVSPGAWMSAYDVIRVTAPRFQGRILTETPRLPFGWVLTYLSPNPSVETKRTPGNEVSDFTGRYLQNYDLVWIYQTAQVGDNEWYMVGPDEWVHQNVIARVIPNTTPPDGVTGDRWIEVNLFEQTIAVYEGYNLVYATLIASGLEPFWTRPGLFQIYEKLESTPMRGAFEADRSDAYYLEDVPWTMYFDERRALHGAYWRANLGFPQSHGCVNMSIGDAQWIFNWATIGDWVYVWDPSGITPTDPDSYTAGGA